MAEIEPEVVPPKLTIQRFTMSGCPSCSSMKRAMTLEKWAAAHSNVRVEEYDLDNALADKMADELGIEGVPALVLIDEEKNVVGLSEGLLTAAGLEKFYAKSLKALEDGNLGAEPRRRKRSRR